MDCFGNGDDLSGDVGDAHAIGRDLNLEVAEARSFDFAALAAEQLSADERADQPADLGRAKERADGGAGSSDCELGHGSGFLRFEAVGGNDATSSFLVGAVLDASTGIGIGVDH